MLITLLQILWVFVSLFLILIILLQRGKGGGLAGALGGAGGSSAFGTKAGDVFTRITVGVFGFWLLLAMILVWSMKPVSKAGAFAGGGNAKGAATTGTDKAGADAAAVKGGDAAVTQESDEKINDAINKMLQDKGAKTGSAPSTGAPVVPPPPANDGKTPGSEVKKEPNKSEPPKGDDGKPASDKVPPKHDGSKGASSKGGATKPDAKANNNPTKAPGSGINTSPKDKTEAVAMLAKYVRAPEGDFDDSHMSDVEKAQLAERLSHKSAIYHGWVKKPAKTGGK